MEQCDTTECMYTVVYVKVAYIDPNNVSSIYFQVPTSLLTQMPAETITYGHWPVPAGAVE